MNIPDDSFSVMISNSQYPNNPSYPNPNPTPNPSKRKRNLPGAPDPDSEVVALSPKSLMATNRFVCEICKKGFQRDQNLQLHRRGHNLPWKLKRSDKDLIIKRKVYVCPVNGCVHHEPSRALGDLTGIKKHYSRKHGEKKWKCDKCSKKYAVQSDWKAHSKICGTREYKCDCGTIFSRKDSFTTHRAFCDALSDEAIRSYTTFPTPATYGSVNIVSGGGVEDDQEELLIRSKQFKLPLWADHLNHHGIGNAQELIIDNGLSNNWSTSPAMFPANMMLKEEDDCKGFLSNAIRAAAEESSYYYGNDTTTSFMSSSSSSSATALLQKAVEMGSTTPNNVSSIFCNSSMNGVMSSNLMSKMADEQQHNYMMSNGGRIINNEDGTTSFVNSNNPFAMIREAVERSTTRDFLGSSAAKIASFGAAAAAMSGQCNTGSLN
ncbi:zinc finger protein BALDIBIS-like [Impatiens glandulifera]|uniref:zinc finger protein BALDIBIS-like n=1 Tax=Impatiens glandulifera TaxID=253017 RepID=UPI001FB14C4C|nr:zinc finger protein BALDIBIS-like [Impatiens glandulifera]